MKSKKYLNIYAICVFSLFIISMQHWIGWGTFGGIIKSLFILPMLYYIIIKRIKLDLSLTNIVASVCFIAYSISNISSIGISLVTALIIPVFFIVCIHSDFKEYILNRILKWYSYLIIPGIFLYIILFFVDLPSLGVLQYTNNISANSTYGICENYFFMLKPVEISASEVLERFRGPFLEPGFLGMMSAWLLFGTGHDYKRRESWIVLLSLLLAMSLAGYILGLIGFLFSRYYQKRIDSRKLLLYTGALLCFIFISQNYNNGDNPVNKAILSRLEYDDEKGIVGNNRTTLVVDAMFLEMFSDAETFWFGYDRNLFKADDNELTGNGFTLFVVKNGFMGLFFACSFYLIITFRAKNKKFSFLMLLFFCICFWQRVYVEWFAWLICYNYPISIQNQKTKVH